jgi:hypothetical protein
MVIEPQATLEGIGQIADHIPLGDRDLRLINGKGAGKEDLFDLEGPRAKRSADDPVEVIVGNNLFVGQ